MAKTMSRRDFLRTTAVSAAALGAMSVLPVRQAGAEENAAPEQTAQPALSLYRKLRKASCGGHRETITDQAVRK